MDTPANIPANESLSEVMQAGQPTGRAVTTPERVFAGASTLQILFSFAAMLGTCLIGRVFFSLRSFQVDPDLWWHIKVGSDIVATHHWPTVDAYSFTVAGQHWLAYEWLGDVLLASVYHLAGLRGLGFLMIVLGSLIALALYFFTTMRCGNPKAAFVASALLLNLAIVSFNLRPQMLGYLFLILTLIALERFRQGQRAAIWLLPLLMVVWINTHGSWIIGLAVIGVYLASGLLKVTFGSLETTLWSVEDRRSLTIVFLLSVAATFITPYGAGLVKYPFEVATSVPASIGSVQEWQPLVFNLPGDKLFIVLLLGFLSAQAVLRRKWRLEEVALFLAAAAIACIHMRFLLVFVPFCAPLLAVILAHWLPTYDRTKEIYALNAVIMLGVFAAMFWYLPSQNDYARMVDARFPVAAVQYLDANSIPGPTYNSYEFGGYLLWARRQVFIDGRTEIYERGGVLSDYLSLANLKPGSIAVLQKYKIQSCLLWRDEPLATVLAALPEWQSVYTDDKSILFVRRHVSASQTQDSVTAQDTLSGSRIEALENPKPNIISRIEKDQRVQAVPPFPGVSELQPGKEAVCQQTVTVCGGFEVTHKVIAVTGAQLQASKAYSQECQRESGWRDTCLSNDAARVPAAR